MFASHLKSVLKVEKRRAGSVAVCLCSLCYIRGAFLDQKSFNIWMPPSFVTCIAKETKKERKSSSRRCQRRKEDRYSRFDLTSSLIFHGVTSNLHYRLDTQRCLWMPRIAVCYEATVPAQRYPIKQAIEDPGCKKTS